MVGGMEVGAQLLHNFHPPPNPSSQHIIKTRAMLQDKAFSDSPSSIPIKFWSLICPMQKVRRRSHWARWWSGKAESISMGWGFLWEQRGVWEMNTAEGLIQGNGQSGLGGDDGLPGGILKQRAQTRWQ